MHAKSKFVTQLVVHVLVMVEVISEYRDQFRVPTPSQLDTNSKVRIQQNLSHTALTADWLKGPAPLAPAPKQPNEIARPKTFAMASSVPKRSKKIKKKLPFIATKDSYVALLNSDQNKRPGSKYNIFLFEPA